VKRSNLPHLWDCFSRYRY